MASYPIRHGCNSLRSYGGYTQLIDLRYLLTYNKDMVWYRLASREEKNQKLPENSYDNYQNCESCARANRVKFEKPDYHKSFQT